MAEKELSTIQTSRPRRELTDRLLKAWIIITLYEEVLGLAVGLVTSGDVWNALENAFAQDSQAGDLFYFYLLMILY